MYSKTDIIKTMKDLPLPKNEYWLITGGAMVLRSFRTQTEDIDLGCTTYLIDKLEKEGYKVLDWKSPYGDIRRKIKYSDNIELFENWIEDKVEYLYDIPIVSIKGLKEMKRKLGRKKDLKDIELIDNFLNSVK